jgi:hypothetical protein
VAVAALATSRTAPAGGGSVSRAIRRAGLAAAGFLWLAAAELLTGRRLLFGLPEGVAPHAAWQDSVTGAAAHALYPLLTSPALAPLAIWAAFAPLLPLLVRGRSLALDLVAAGAWAVALVAAHFALGDLLTATTALGEPRGAVGGAVLGGLAAAAAAGLAAPARAPRPGATLSRP